MAPPDLSSLLICGLSGPLPNDHPFMNPSYNPCILCGTSTWRRCSKCSSTFYCSLRHENIHWSVHMHICPGSPHRKCTEQRKTIIRPLKAYCNLPPDEKLLIAPSFYFSPDQNVHERVDIECRPIGFWWDGWLAGPCPILGKYFLDDAPHFALLESDGTRRIEEPLAIWYSKTTLHSGKFTNTAILSLFGPHEQPRHLWRGAVIVMKFSNSSFRDFVPVTDSDLTCLKSYFSNFLGDKNMS